MRRLASIRFADGKNSMQHLRETASMVRIIRNFAVIQVSRYIPFLRLKNWLFRSCLGMQVGQYVSVGLMVMLDIVKPELIHLGNNCIIGYNTTILAHEYLIEEFRYGEVSIGENVLIGANCTILAGISIGHNAVVAAGTVVTQDVAPFTLVGGNPMQVLRRPDMDKSPQT